MAKTEKKLKLIVEIFGITAVRVIRDIASTYGVSVDQKVMELTISDSCYTRDSIFLPVEVDDYDKVVPLLEIGGVQAVWTTRLDKNLVSRENY